MRDLSKFSDGSMVSVKQVRSCIGRSVKFRRVLDSLGLGRVGNKTTFKMNSSVRGSLAAVDHVVEISKQ